MNLPEITKKLRALADELDAANSAKLTTELKSKGYEQYGFGPAITIVERSAPFTLPTPPPGMKWHRTDGWAAEMLEKSERPLVSGERYQKGDFYGTRHNWKIVDGIAGDSMDRWTDDDFSKTTRPLLFQHAGHEWTWHRAGDPMPCDGGREVITLLEDSSIGGKIRAGRFDWGKRDDGEQIIGWRYADAELKAVPASEKPCGYNSALEEVTGVRDPYAELKAAHAEGKVIQCEQHSFGSRYWRAIDNPQWDAEPSLYRIKPDEAPWIEWHGGKCPLSDEEVEEWQIKWANGDITTNPKAAPSDYIWTKLNSPDDIAAYRVTKWRKPAPKQKLGPEDVPPFSLIRRKPEQNNGEQWHWRCVSYVHNVGIQCGDRGYKWKEMQKDYQINRSLPLTGKWNPEAWEACEK